MKLHFAQLLVLTTIPSLLSAQGTKTDYERAAGLRSLTSGKVYKSVVRPNWIGPLGVFWYKNDLPGGVKEFILVNPSIPQKSPAFDHEKLATILGEKLKHKVDPQRLPFDRLIFAQDLKTMRFGVENLYLECNLSTYTLSDATKETTASTSYQRESVREVVKAESPFAPDDPEFFVQTEQGPNALETSSEAAAEFKSPDGRLIAIVKDSNVFLKDVASGKETSVTKDGDKNDSYEGAAFWSPDSRRFVVYKTIPSEAHTVYLVESSPRDQLQPKLHPLEYLKPGDRIAHPRPKLFDATIAKETPVKDDLFPNPWEANRLKWQQDSKQFTFLYNQRGHQVMRWIGVNAETGEANAIINEEAKTFVDYTNKVYLTPLESSHEAIWMSERDGWNHLYLYDTDKREVKNQITKGDWVVRSIERVNSATRQIWFTASGIYPDQDPYYNHFCRINFDGTGLIKLTAGNGTHTVTYSPNQDYIVDSYSRVDMPPVTELLSATDGHKVLGLEKGDATELIATGWKVPERFVAKARDGITDIYGIIWRPTNFDPSKKYPVIENIYAGPQGSFVPKAFSPFFNSQELAELGFIVVQMDGMGTNNRSKAFHDVCFKNLGDAGFPDRILWHKAAAAKYPYMDLTRVGIYGTSAGGQNALGGILQYPEFYKACMADCGCHDNRMDKIWWNEQWMSWPIGPHYREQSNAILAPKLKGKLLLMVGEMDNNVDPASTFQVVNALIQNDKDFDLIVSPGTGHGVAGTPYGRRRMRDFFVKTLLGVEPRAN